MVCDIVKFVIMKKTPEFIDTHTHLNFSAFDVDRQEVLARTLEEGVWMVNIGTQKNTSKKAVEIARQFDKGVYATVGIHPIHTGRAFFDVDELGQGGETFTSRREEFDKDFYRQLARDEKVVAIGECGLDYFRIEEGESAKKKQREAFAQQIELALEIDLPLVIHSRETYKEVYDILLSYHKQSGEKLKAVIHFFSGDVEFADKFLDLGFLLSFTAVITLTPAYDEVLAYTPLNRLMSETDCPYVAPKIIRGRRNEPVYVKEVVKRIIEIRNEPACEIKSSLVKNAFNFYQIG